MIPVTVRRLQVFVAVVDAKGFSSAAASLGISQPSVSVHINALEKLVGSPLFIRRNGATPQLTDIGRQFCAYARDTLQRADKIAADLGHQSRPRRPRLSCAAHRSVAHSLLPRALAVFSETYPDVELVTHTGNFDEVRELYQNGAVDLFVLVSAGDIPGLRSDLIGRAGLSLFAAPHHRLAGLRRISPQELARHPFVSPYRDSHFGRAIQAALSQAGVKISGVAAQMSEVSLVRALVTAGAGFSCTLRRNIARELEAGEVVELDVNIAPLSLGLRVAHHAGRSAAEVRKLVRILRQAEFQH